MRFMPQCGTLNLPSDNMGCMEPDDEQWEKARQTVEQYQPYADELVSELLDACRKNDSLRGSLVTTSIHRRGDIKLLMMVLGGLSGYAISAEKSAIRAHGPLITPEEGDADNSLASEPWATSAVDQMKAAASNNDYTTFGSLAVDSHIKALIHDKSNYGEDAVTLPHVVRAMMMIDQQTLSVLAAEALLRLMAIYDGG